MADHPDPDDDSTSETTSTSDDVPLVIVHARLPDATNALVWKWGRVLRFPISTMTTLSPNDPWRWILFACGTVFGTKHGKLCTSEDDTELLSLDDPAPDLSTKVWFHVDDPDRDSLLPVDPDMCVSRTGTEARERAKDFRTLVSSRDGHQCVVTQMDIPELLIASHLIPHVKGHEYILNLTKFRRDAAYDNDIEIIDDIDDVRNGVLASQQIHSSFGRHTAIMKKPNFAFPQADPSWDFHVLRLDLSYVPKVVQRAVLPVRVPADKTRWPQAVLFDQVYGTTVLKSFGLPTAMQSTSHLARKYFGEINSRQQRRREEEQSQHRQKETDDLDANILNRGSGEGPPEFATWQSLLPLDRQWRVYNLLAKQAEARRDAEVNERVVSWLDKAQT